MKVSIDKKVFEKFPSLSELVIFAEGINVSTSHSQDILKELRKVEQEVRDKYDKDSFKESSLYKEWMSVYKEIIASLPEGGKKDVKKAMPSHLALMKRVIDGKDLPNINPMVNFYNMLSLKYELPFGVENIDEYYGDAQLCFAEEGVLFAPIGTDEYTEVSKGELVWKDSLSVTCRMWNWRQSERTKVDNRTKNVVFYIDMIAPGMGGSEQISQMVGETARLVKLYFGAEISSHVLDANTPIVKTGFKAKSTEGIPIIEKGPSAKKSKKKGNKGVRGRKPISLGLSDPNELLTSLANEIAEKVNVDPKDLNLAYPPNKEFGDISSTIAFVLAKERKCSPKDAAEQLISELESAFGKEYFDDISIAGNGFLNLKLSTLYIAKKLMEASEDIDRYGLFTNGNGQKFLIESPSWNPNKTAHVGHTLNLFIGKALVRLFEAVGYEVTNDNITNDKGLPVMQTVWAYMAYGEGKDPEGKPDHYVDQFYKMGKKAYDIDENVKEEVKEILRKWESGDEDTVKVWKKIINWAFEGQEQTFNRLGEEVGYVWYESDVYQGGKDVVMSHLDSEYLDKLDGQAVIARIEQEYGLPDTILIKSDGTGLYHTQDIYLTMKKKEKFGSDKLVWVVGEEQIAHFQRLFAILDALKIMPIDDLYHYPYSHVVDQDGKKLSSRDGEDLSVDELIQMMQDKSKEYLGASKGDYSSEEVENISREVSIGALKYSLLSRDPFKKIKFDLDEALSYQGKSGPYIMYAYTRANGILSRVSQPGGVTANLGEIELKEQQRDLIIEILKYPGIVLSASNNYSPAILAEYLYDLAKSFNNFYENLKVLELEGDELVIATKSLEMFMEVLKKGMAILGINVIEKM